MGFLTTPGAKKPGLKNKGKKETKKPPRASSRRAPQNFYSAQGSAPHFIGSRPSGPGEKGFFPQWRPSSTGNPKGKGKGGETLLKT